MKGIIYALICKVSCNFYIGSTMNYRDRKRDHISDLKKGVHHCRSLQMAWNKHGQENFIFQAIETCDKGEILEREQFYINSLDPAYNSARLVGRPSEANRERARIWARDGLSKIPWTEERREKARQRRLGKPPVFHPDTREKMSQSAKIRKARDKANGIPGPWALKILKEGPKLCSCGCKTKIGRQSTWARGHNKFSRILTP